MPLAWHLERQVGAVPMLLGQLGPQGGVLLREHSGME
jgi:hypothetical protein